MQPKDPTRPSIDPRELVRKHGREALARVLASTGYVPQELTLIDLALALRRCKPLLLGGHRGLGKTALAEALAEGCNLVMYYVPGVEGMRAEEVLGGWDLAEQERAVSQAIAAGQTPEIARRQKWAEEFFECGEFLDAFRCAGEAAEAKEPPPVLIVDEVEKLSVVIQNTLLQPLARGWANVPKLKGVIGVRDRSQMPIILLTSNNTSLLSDPLKSRCFLSWMQAPTPREEVEIFRARVPQAPPRLLAAVVKIIHLIRWDMPQVRDKPGLRESIDLLEALAEDGVRDLTEEVIYEYLACLGKGPKELANLRESVSRLASAANARNSEIDEWVGQAFVREGEETRLEEMEEAA